MDGACGNQKVIMLLRGQRLTYVGGKRVTSGLRATQIVRHLLRIDAFLQSEIDAGSGLGIQQVVALILRVVHAELVLNVFSERMNLQRQIASAHCVEEVEADRKLCSKPRMHSIAKKLHRLQKDEIDCGNLNPVIAETKEKTVLLGHAIEAPRIVWRIRGRSQTSSIQWPPQGPGSK